MVIDSSHKEGCLFLCLKVMNVKEIVELFPHLIIRSLSSFKSFFGLAETEYNESLKLRRVFFFQDCEKRNCFDLSIH